MKGWEREDWELGPFIKVDEVNPVLGPLNETLFFCPLRQSYVAWEAKDVFNPTAMVRDGKIHLLYRAEDWEGMFAGTSRIGLATSTDGLHFERMPTPIFYPANDSWVSLEWEGGCEDPRIVEDETGTYYMTYTAFDGTVARLLIASSTDLETWTKYGPIFGGDGEYKDLWSKSGSIVTRRDGDKFIAVKLNGKYWMYWGDTNIYCAWSDNLINWFPMTDNNGATEYNLTIVFGPREGKFDSQLVEPGPQAILSETEESILLIYNSRNLGGENGGDPELPEGTYAAGQVLLNPGAPWELVARTENYFMKPDKDYEVIGQVNNVVFLEGLVSYNGKMYLYYGTADSKIAVAVFDENN